MKKKVNLYLIIFTLCISCTYKDHNDHFNQENKASHIVLIIRKCPVNWQITLPDGGSYNSGKFELSYLDDHLIPKYITPKYTPLTDTIVIQTNKNHIEISHQYQGMDKFTYLFKNGDSVVFDYIGKKPHANVINRKTLKYDVNYELIKREKIFVDMINLYSGRIQYDVPSFFVEPNFSDWKNYKLIRREIKNKGKLIFKEQLLREIKLLDSLKKANLISEDSYTFYKNFNRAESNRLLLDEGELSSSEVQSILEEYKFLMEIYSYDISLLNTISFKTYQENLPVIKTGNGSYHDFRILFDSLMNSELFNDNVKSFMMRRSLEGIIEHFDINDINKYLNKFKSEIKDTILVNHIISKYNLDLNISSKLKLRNLNGNEVIDFQQVLDRVNQKVIYIDFWASWCAPCVKAMPGSKSLQNTYKDVVFMYLSIDDSFEKWQQSSNKHKLEEVKHNYLIENRYTSTWLESLNLSSIPRYMIFDKQGNLVHKNAPGPDSDEIRNLFDKYLSE